MTGKVKFFNEAKGYGFITDSENTETDYFFHVSGTSDKLKKDDQVQFELENGKRGFKAVKIHKV